MKKLPSTSAQPSWDCLPEPNELTQPIDQGAAEYSGFVIVRLSRHVPFGGEAIRDLRELAKRLQLQGLLRLLEQWPDVSTRPLIRSLDPEKLIDLERQAAKSIFRPLHSLTAYWRLDTRGLFQDEIEKFLNTLNSLPEVNLAYLERSAIDPMPSIGSTNPYLVNQSYLEAAPQGVGARWAWTQTHGRGAGVGFVVVERAWLPSHEDLDGKNPTLIVNANQNGIGDGDGNHGTAVLAVAAGIDNTVGVIGIAHEAASVGLASHYDAELGVPGQVADAILGAIASMAPGDVLLLEVIRGSALVNFPTETDPADLDAIRLAVALGIVVIEAAGNSNRNLDQWSDPLGRRRLNRTDRNFVDSGAVLVGAAFPDVTSDGRHNRLPFSNFGSRVDCYSWGIGIVTAGYGDLANTGNGRTYTGIFRGTSGAAAIIAGVALVLQGLYEPTVGTRLSPMQLRSLLVNPATGTLQGTGLAGNIGVMPNLQAIAQSLALAPDVYLRDSLGDSGLVPSTGPIGTSPDILLHTALVKNPTQYFDTGEGDVQLGSASIATQDYYLYVRIRNRGGAPASGVTAKVYWSKFVTLSEPTTWTLIGTSAPVNVPVGNTPVVTDAIAWKSAHQPKGPYTLITVLDHPQDPAPPLPTGADWDAVLQFVRRQNNVAQRNISVIEINLEGGLTGLTFILAGAGDRDRCFDLEIVQQLPEQISVWWEIPLSLLAVLPPPFSNKAEIDTKQQRAKLLLPRLRQLPLQGIRLARAVHYETHFLIQSGEAFRRSDHQLIIRQLYKNQEVGRLTWVLRAAKKRLNGFKLPC